MVRHHRAGRRSSGRGVTYWTDGAGDERIFVVMNSYMLVALDAKTGRQVASFGKNGVVDLAENLRWNERPGLPREGRVANTSPLPLWATSWSHRSRCTRAPRRTFRALPSTNSGP